MQEVVVDDNYIIEMSNFFTLQGERFETFLKNYIALMRVVVIDGIQSGKTKDALETYIDIAKELQGNVGDLMEIGTKLTNAYLIDTDNADEYLY